MAERQARHRQGLEASLVKAECRDSLLGLIFGLIIGLVTIGGGFYCILAGYQIAGGLLSFSGLSSLVGTFIYGSKTKKPAREEAQKQKTPEEQ
jgi:hypothetical protein